MTRPMVPLACAVLFLAGCGNREGDESVAKKAGDQVGQAVTDFATGVGRGVDKQLVVMVELSEELSSLGMSKTVAKAAPKDLGGDPTKGRAITVYLVATKPVQGTLLAKALNKEGQEIGRAAAEVEFAADDAKYVTFHFEEEMDSQLVDKYTVSLKKPAAEGTAQPAVPSADP